MPGPPPTTQKSLLSARRSTLLNANFLDRPRSNLRSKAEFQARARRVWRCWERSWSQRQAHTRNEKSKGMATRRARVKAKVAKVRSSFGSLMRCSTQEVAKTFARKTSRTDGFVVLSNAMNVFRNGVLVNIAVPAAARMELCVTIWDVWHHLSEYSFGWARHPIPRAFVMPSCLYLSDIALVDRTGSQDGVTGYMENHAQCGC